MSNDAHTVLIFYGSIAGIIVIYILCIVCIVYNRIIRTRDVAPVIIIDEEDIYAKMNNEKTSLNGNSV